MSRDSIGHLMILASAGSGKTHQLTNRYLRLAGAGALPEAMLATTFTRKAAGEILDRVLKRLAEAAGDAGKAAELAREIDTEHGSQADFARLLRAMVTSLPRARIGTLDSFYIALGGSFALELGLPPGWSICEVADDEALHRDALERLLQERPDDVANLLPLLSKGESKRSVQEELTDVIHRHAECFLGSRRQAWEALVLPEPVDPAKRAVALEQLQNFDFADCGGARFANARDDDVANFQREDWLIFIAGGLAKALLGDGTYYRKQIPPACRAIYEPLLQHAKWAILAKVGQQTRATWDLLDRFQGELRALKQATGQLRFHEVTQALVDALAGQVLRPEVLAFRLDGAIEHLLLDEFQDTSLPQWRVLEPMARAIIQPGPGPLRTFFCVGDVKQAIYGWRGGMAEIFYTLKTSLGDIAESPLDESWRSAQPIIDVVNEVFGNVAQWPAGDKYQDGLAAWGARFKKHTTVKKKEPGYVRFETGPAQKEDQTIAAQRAQHCAYVAGRIQELVQQVSHTSVGVLCRKNDTAGYLIYQLRRLGVAASAEGGNPLTDSPAVELLLSLFTLADHPGHSVAWFHLRHSPLQKLIEAKFTNPDIFADHLRRRLFAEGYGRFAYTWAKQLTPACDGPDLARLQQLVEMAYDYQPRSTLRADDFVAWVRQQRVADPTSARVRVMTVHAAKGLQFDVVVLPELDVNLTGQAPSYVVGRDATSLTANFVCRYAREEVQKLMVEAQRRVFAEDRREDAEESLSLLYVAMTRAASALHLFMPGQRKRPRKDAWYSLLRQALAPAAAWPECTVLYEHGDGTWFKKANLPQVPATGGRSDRPARITFAAAKAQPRRGLDPMAPSRREGQGCVVLERLFQPSQGTGTAAGTLYHAWFETIAWLDDGMPTEAMLRAAAERIRMDLPPDTWRELETLLGRFRGWLKTPAIEAVLARSAYKDPQQRGFPARLAPFWAPSITRLEIERERRFVVPEGGKLWTGSLDRIVWLSDESGTVAADILDFKTDAIGDDQAALAQRTEHYRPQLEAYRHAVARLGNLPAERVAARLVFTFAARIIDV
jgi:ATP-dependent helicase/nuclease subunit A